MTRGRGELSLLAKLSPDRMFVLCGRCGGDMAYVAMVRDEYRDGSGWSNPYRVLRFVAGWRPEQGVKRGVWVFPPQALEQFARGRSPYQHPMWSVEPEIGLFGGKEPTRLPVWAVCPSCHSKQELDAAALDVRPGGAIDHAILGDYVIVPGRRPTG
jgi:hypothetical protein